VIRPSWPDGLEAALERLVSLRANLPDRERIPERYVTEYHEALDDLTEATGRDLTAYRIREDELSPARASSLIRGGLLRHNRGKSCDKRLLKTRLDAFGWAFGPDQLRSPFGFRPD
jgi:hypothetical protein